MRCEVSNPRLRADERSIGYSAPPPVPPGDYGPWPIRVLGLLLLFLSAWVLVQALINQSLTGLVAGLILLGALMLLVTVERR